MADNSSNGLSMSYELKLPSNTRSLESLSPSKEYKYPVPVNPSQKEYYRSLHEQVLKAKTQIGADLTLWRDAVGKLENKKEPPKIVKESDEEDESGE